MADKFERMVIENHEAQNLGKILISKKEYDRYVEKVCEDNLKETNLDAGLLRVLIFGAKKYAPDSWKDHKKDFIAACKRHLAFVEKNLESLDAESGLPHIDHAICNLMFIRYQMIENIS